MCIWQQHCEMHLNCLLKCRSLMPTFWCCTLLRHCLVWTLHFGSKIGYFFKDASLCGQIWLAAEDIVALSTPNTFSMDCLRGKDTASRRINILSQSLSGEEDPCCEMVNCSKVANAVCEHRMPGIQRYWTLLQKVMLNAQAGQWVMLGLHQVKRLVEDLLWICLSLEDYIRQM